MSFHSGWTEHSRRVVLLFICLSVILATIAVSIRLGYRPRSFQKSILITVEYRGAFEEEVERLIVIPLEERISRIRGVREIFAVAEREKARLTVTFSQDVELGGAYLEVREAVQAAASEFPENVQRPLIVNSDAESDPVFIASFDPGAGASSEELKRLFGKVEGCGEIEVGGAVRPELQVFYDPQRLAAARTSLKELVTAVRNWNVVGGFGTESGPAKVLDSRPRCLDELRRLPINRNLSLQELAEVRLEQARSDSIGRVNGQERMIVYVQPAGNAAAIPLCRRLENITASLAGSEVLYSYGRLVEAALLQVACALAAGTVLVMLLTFLFLGRLFAALMVSLNIPFSMLAAAAVLRLCGEELNLLSLSGLAVGAGLVIDAGIVFVDQYFRWEGTYADALVRARDPILFSAATTVAVFLPLLFAPRPLLRQFGGLALAISASVAASCLFVFFFLPAFLHGHYGSSRGGISGSPAGPPGLLRFRPGEALDRRLQSGCRRLFWMLHRNRLPVGVSLAVLVASVLVVGLGLDRQAPGEESAGSNALHFVVEYPSGRTREFVLRSTAALEEYLAALPGVRRSSSRFDRERASFVLILEESADREVILAAVRERESEFPEAFFYFPRPARGESAINIVISGLETTALRRLARSLSEQMQHLPGCEGIVFHFKEALPAFLLQVDLLRTASSGIDARDLYAQAHWALSSAVADKWTVGATEMDIRLSGLSQESRRLKALLALPAGAGRERSLPLGALVRVAAQEQVGRIYRLDRRRIVSFAVLTDQRSRAALLRDIRRLLELYPFPAEYRAEVDRSESEAGELAGAALASLGLGVLLIFFILMFQFESLRVTGIVMLQIPLSFTFPILLIKFLDWSLTVPVLVGLVLTAGITVNNAILVFSELAFRHGARQRAGEPVLLAPLLCEAWIRQLRPLLLSSLATAAGVSPLLFSGRANQGVLAPLSVTIAAGITGSLAALLLSLAVAARAER